MGSPTILLPLEAHGRAKPAACLRKKRARARASAELHTRAGKASPGTRQVNIACFGAAPFFLRPRARSPGAFRRPPRAPQKRPGGKRYLETEQRLARAH